jgi:hypothetical protein
MFRQMGAIVERSCWAISSEARWRYYDGLREVGVPDVFQAPSVLLDVGLSATFRLQQGRIDVNR